MADVFISYASEDRLLALKVSALLEAHGYSTWWDTALRGGDAFRDSISSELTQAAAVVVIWTENSVQSDWVRAEAGRARQHGKLVPLKTGTLHYDDIPLPFGELHTDALEDEQIIVETVARQLAAAPETPAFWKLLRHDAMTWISIAGTAVTLVTNLRGVLQLADWIRIAVERWVDLITFVWGKAFFFLPKIAAPDAILLTLFVFLLRTFFAFKSKVHDSIFARDLWLKRMDAPLFDRLAMVAPVAFCLLAFVIGYLDMLGAINKDVLTGRASIPALNDKDIGVFSSYLMNYVLLDLPGNWQVAQISLICFAIPFFAMEILSLALRRSIDFPKAARRAAAVMFLLVIIIGANYLSLWAATQAFLGAS